MFSDQPRQKFCSTYLQKQPQEEAKAPPVMRQQEFEIHAWSILYFHLHPSPLVLDVFDSAEVQHELRAQDSLFHCINIFLYVASYVIVAL